MNRLHNYHLVKASKENQVKYPDHILAQRHLCQLPNRPTMYAQANLRELRFLSITIPNDYLIALLKDLDYTDGGNKIHLLLRKLSGFGASLLGLTPAPHRTASYTMPHPRWREYIILEILAQRKLEGDKTELYLLLSAQRKYLDEFETFLYSRDYMKAPIDHLNEKYKNRPRTMEVKLDIKEIRLYDVSGPQSIMGGFLGGIHPFKSVDELVPNWISWVFKKIRKLSGVFIDPNGSNLENNALEWMNEVDITVLARKEDGWHRDPRTGALIEEEI